MNKKAIIEKVNKWLNEHIKEADHIDIDIVLERKDIGFGAKETENFDLDVKVFDEGDDLK